MRLVILAVLALCATAVTAAENTQPYPIPIAGGDVDTPEMASVTAEASDARIEATHISRGSNAACEFSVATGAHPNERSLAAPHDLTVHAYAIPDGGRRALGFDVGRRQASDDKHGMQIKPLMLMNRAGNGRTRNLYQRGEPVALVGSPR